MTLNELLNSEILNSDMGLNVYDEQGCEVYIVNVRYAWYCLSGVVLNMDIDQLSTNGDYSIDIKLKGNFEG